MNEFIPTYGEPANGEHINHEDPRDNAWRLRESFSEFVDSDATIWALEVEGVSLVVQKYDPAIHTVAILGRSLQ